MLESKLSIMPLFRTAIVEPAAIERSEAARKLETEARRRAIKALELKASLNAVDFYEQMGFIRSSEKTWAVQGCTLRMVVMGKDL